MKIHKTYECEYCGQEFDEATDAGNHELNCDFKPSLKRCGSCGFAEIATHYENEYVRCRRLRRTDATEPCWTTQTRN
jgi:hypothetical protein